MSRTIDPHKLNGADVGYLLERPWMIEEYRRQGLGNEMDAVVAGQPTAEDPTDVSRITTTEMSQGHQAPTLEGPRPDGVTDDSIDDNYEEWTKEDLSAEVDARNAEVDRADTQKIKKGTVAAMAKALHEDDAVEV